MTTRRARSETLAEQHRRLVPARLVEDHPWLVQPEAEEHEPLPIETVRFVTVYDTGSLPAGAWPLLCTTSHGDPQCPSK